MPLSRHTCLLGIAPRFPTFPSPCRITSSRVGVRSLCESRARKRFAACSREENRFEKATVCSVPGYFRRADGRRLWRRNLDPFRPGDLESDHCQLPGLFRLNPAWTQCAGRVHPLHLYRYQHRHASGRPDVWGLPRIRSSNYARHPPDMVGTGRIGGLHSGASSQFYRGRDCTDLHRYVGSEGSAEQCRPDRHTGCTRRLYRRREIHTCQPEWGSCR